MVTSSGTADDAPNAPTYAAYADKIDSAKSQRAIALVAVGAGAALVTAGVFHYVLRSGPVEATAWLDGVGGGLGVGGRF